MNRTIEPRDATAGTDAGPVDTVGRQRLVTLGGLLGALAACSCCILPLALFGLGIGGAWIGRLTALAPYQPIFMAVAFGFLVAGHWLAYRKPKAACVDGEACARPLPDRLVKAGLWTATALVTAALTFPYLASMLLGI